MRTLWTGVPVRTSAESTPAERERRRDLVDTLGSAVDRLSAAGDQAEELGKVSAALWANLLWLTDGDAERALLVERHLDREVPVRDALILVELGVAA